MSPPRVFSADKIEQPCAPQIAQASFVQNVGTAGHIRALDGLRGFAVLLVFTYHVFYGHLDLTSRSTAFFVKICSSGWIGVDLFFVLSGFLVTGVLLDARESDNYFKVFYIRRALRIFPLYYGVLLASLLLEPLHYSFHEQIFYWLNLSNLPTAFHPFLIPYLAHFWSLGIEEQFYLVWPWVVRKLKVRYIVGTCAALIVLVFLVKNLQGVLRLNSVYPELVYRLTPFRIDTLCAGALLAIAIRYRPDLLRNRAALWSVLVLSAVVFAASGQFYRERHVIRFGYTAVLVCFSALLALALSPGSLVARIFSNGFLRRVGKYSYAFYLFHPFVVNSVAAAAPWIRTGFNIHGPERIGKNSEVMLMYPIEFAVVFGLAALSWNFFERPILGFKRLFRNSPRPEHQTARTPEASPTCLPAVR